MGGVSPFSEWNIEESVKKCIYIYIYDRNIYIVYMYMYDICIYSILFNYFRSFFGWKSPSLAGHGDPSRKKCQDALAQALCGIEGTPGVSMGFPWVYHLGEP